MTTVTISKTRPSTPIGRQNNGMIRIEKNMQQHKNGDAPHQDAATAVSHFHTHSVPLDMEDIRRDWDKPISEPASPPRPASSCASAHWTWVPEPEASACAR